MLFTPLDVEGAFLVDIEAREDARGFFARTFCADEFVAHGLSPAVVQCSVSHNSRRGTLRGMHFQAAPCEEAKLVRCTSGAMFDVLLDLRAGSKTFGRWASADLTEENRRSVYVPPGVAHGFLVLLDRTEVLYQMSVPYSPEHARGVRWNDPAFGIAWPLERAGVSEPILSERDRSYEDYSMRRSS